MNLRTITYYPTVFDIYCCGNHQSQRPIVTQSINLFSRVSSGNYKRTQQRVSAGLLPYLYELHMVCATNNYSCPNVHASSMSTLYIHYEVAMSLIYFLMLSIQNYSSLFQAFITSHHVTCHVTAVSHASLLSIKRKEI